MRLRFFPLFTLLLVVGYSAFSQQKSPAVVYLETIGNEFNAVYKEMMSYTSAAAHSKSARKIDKRRQDLLLRIQAAERNIRKQKPFEGDPSLRDTVVEYFDISYHVLAEDFEKIVDMEEVAEQSYDLMEAYLLAKERANEKLDLAFAKVDRKQAEFVSRHGIRIIENSSKLSQKMEISGKVINYYNQIYLIFFKSYKDEAYLLEALSNTDVNAKQQTNNALLTSSQQGLSQLGPMPGFSGDGSLKVACQQVLNFFKHEATSSTPILIDFDVRKENFEKMKKSFEAKQPSDRTKAEVDLFNKTAKEYNESVGKVNDTINQLNRKRNEVLLHWEKMANQFLDKHIPKYGG